MADLRSALWLRGRKYPFVRCTNGRSLKPMSLINLFVAARSAIARWRQRQRAYGELMALDDRSLADIGIHRSQIPAIAEKYSAPPHTPPMRDPPLGGEPNRAWLAAGHR